MQTHPRSMTCPCAACNEDLLVFSDDEGDTEPQTPDLDTRSDIATIGLEESNSKPYDPRDDPYHPGNKGDATWNEDQIFTADGWILCIRPIRKIHYQSVKGIDLVRWFTENHVREQKAKEEKRQRSLTCPKPQSAAIADLTETESRRSHRTNRGQRSQGRFLSLPAEIRNKIYSYTIPECRILIHSNKPGKQYAKEKSYWSSLDKYKPKTRYRLSHLLDNNDLDDGLELTGALLWVCKKIKAEVELFMYAQLTFCFDSTKVLRKFIDRSTAESLRAITKLELQHIGYGEPRLMKDRVFKEKHDRNWQEACEIISEEFLSLRSLRLDLRICDWPVTLRRDDFWMRAALELVSRKRPEDVKVTLTHSHNMIREDRLQRAARRLEDLMMSPEGKFIRDEREANMLIQQHLEAESLAEAARLERLKMLPPVQAKRVLRIVLAEKDNNKAVKSKERKYVTSKIAGYGRTHDSEQ